MDNTCAEQKRINHINELLDRLDKIPFELDRIHEKLYKVLSRRQFEELVAKRSNLIEEQITKEQELRDTYNYKPSEK